MVPVGSQRPAAQSLAAVPWQHDVTRLHTLGRREMLPGQSSFGSRGFWDDPLLKDLVVPVPV